MILQREEINKEFENLNSEQDDFLPLEVQVHQIEGRPNFQSLSDITRIEELRRANRSISAMASLVKNNNDQTTRKTPILRE